MPGLRTIGKMFILWFLAVATSAHMRRESAASLMEPVFYLRCEACCGGAHLLLCFLLLLPPVL